MIRAGVAVQGPLVSSIMAVYHQMEIFGKYYCFNFVILNVLCVLQQIYWITFYFCHWQQQLQPYMRGVMKYKEKSRKIRKLVAFIVDFDKC